MLSRFRRFVVLEEFSEIGVDLKFVGVRIWSFALAELLDLFGSDLRLILAIAWDGKPQLLSIPRSIARCAQWSALSACTVGDSLSRLAGAWKRAHWV